MPTDAVFPVRFDPDALDDDLLHVTPRRRQVAVQARAELEREGIPAGRLYRCGSEMTDGPTWAGASKPGSRGRTAAGESCSPVPLTTTGTRTYRSSTFGERHHREPWRLSVYQLAHQRLHAGA